MAKQLLDSIILLLICLLSSTRNTRQEQQQQVKVNWLRALSLSEQTVYYKAYKAFDYPQTRAPEQARERPKALSVPQSPENTTECGGETTWCIAKPSTGDERLNANIEFCCKQAGIDCRIIQPGGKCYEPFNISSHASVVMNLYYKANNKQPHDCDFIQSGLIISQDPSVGECLYEA